MTLPIEILCNLKPQPKCPFSFLFPWENVSKQCCCNTRDAVRFKHLFNSCYSQELKRKPTKSKKGGHCTNMNFKHESHPLQAPKAMIGFFCFSCFWLSLACGIWKQGLVETAPLVLGGLFSPFELSLCFVLLS